MANNKNQLINSVQSFYSVFKKTPKINQLNSNYSELLLSKLEEGVFVLNENLNFVDSYTSVLEELIDEKELLNKSFLEILQQHIAEDMVKSTQDYINVLFREDLDEKMLSELNPLSNIEFQFKDKLGLWKFSKFLSFTFYRVYNGININKLLCIVKDISDNVVVVEKLAKAEEKNKKQMEWMMNILHINPVLMEEFMDIFEFKLKKVENTLKNSSDILEQNIVINDIFSSIQMIARIVTILDLRFFKENTKSITSEIERIKNKEHIDGNDFVTIVLQINKLHNKFNDIKELFNKLKKFKNSLRTTRRYESELLIGTLDKLIEELAQDTNKKVAFVHEKFDSNSIPYELLDVVREFLFALTRFVVIYIFENNEERRIAEIEYPATIELENEISGTKNIIKYKHNGKLIKTERYLQKEIEADLYKYKDGQKGDDSSGLDSKVIQMFFTPLPPVSDNAEGIESSDILYKHIQEAKRKLAARGGRIKITFTTEQSMEYIISLPSQFN